MDEAFAGDGEVFIDRCEMIFQRLVKSPSMRLRSLVSPSHASNVYLD
jgi:hypothetical protein